MSEKDLEQTKPIKVLSDLTDSRLDRYENEEKDKTRSEKYEDVLIDDERKEQEEVAEEALAEKNIAMAEALLSNKEEPIKENKKVKKEVDDDDDDDDEITEDDGLLGKLIVKWRGLSDKKKKLIIAGTIIGLIVFIALIIFLILILTGDDKEKVPAKKEEVKEEIVPVVVDNFYYKDGKLHFLKEDETELGIYECSNKDDKLCYVGTNVNSDKFDVARLESSDGAVRNQRLPIYEDNYVFVFDNKDEKSNEIILYSIKENKEVARYLEVKSYSDNYVIVKTTDEKYGLIQINNGVVEVIKPQYSYLGMIDGESNLIAKSKKGYAVINKKNKVLSSYYDSKLEIKNYNDKYVVTLTGDDYSVYDYKANLIDTGYEFINVVDKYVVLVNNKQLYIKDNEGLKYNENAVKLSNNNYIKTFVYDENDQLVDTKRSYEINVKNNNIEVAVYPNKKGDVTYTQLSIIEALANKKYEYVNYFNKKLFFYSDLEKKELIGTYPCSIENIITKSDEEYTSCFVATDTIMEDNDMISEGDLTRKSRTPIINKKYVFVKDGTNMINLYNLVDKKTEVSYLKVNTMIANNDNKITHHSGKLETIVQTKSGKYGVISFEGEDVGKVHSFEYNSLEKIGENYLALDTSGSWRVLYHGNESVGFTNKIRGYNSTKLYYKVLESGKYYVYDNTGTKLNTEGYAYVELYGNYYAAINSDKEVNIYDYDGTKLNIRTVPVGNYKYYGVANPAFKVAKDGEDYVVSVWDGTKYNVTNLTMVIEETPVPEPGVEDNTQSES